VFVAGELLRDAAWEKMIEGGQKEKRSKHCLREHQETLEGRPSEVSQSSVSQARLANRASRELQVSIQYQS
jgi:hypothetical protein